MGLFTTDVIQRGAAVGIWTGRSVSIDEYVDDQYGVELSYPGRKDSIVVTPVESDGSVDLAAHPMAAVNEPKTGSRANLYLQIEEYEATNTEDNLSSRYLIMIFYASEDVPANKELFWHYGAHYHRIGYTEGLPARCVDSFPKERRFQRLLNERPDGVHIFMSTPSNTQESDPDYN